ncbi:hypothetical protein AwDysgo_12150 [Bacteroidales bacterium]|nr:hypothetical protein AwDysgo_12150 [Bacteroidales bacterium]
MSNIVSQGSQFTSDVFVKVLTDNDIKISMDGKGRVLDNIFIERLCKSVKYEDVYLHVYENGLSLHQSLDYKTAKEKYKRAA